MLYNKVGVKKIEENIKEEIAHCIITPKPISMHIFSFLDFELNIVNSQEDFEDTKTNCGNARIG